MSRVSFLIIICVPGLILLLHRVEKKFGATRMGWVASFPVLGAPSLLLLTVQHGVAFGSHAAGNAALGLIGWWVFILWYRLSDSWLLLRASATIIVFVSVLSWALCGLSVVHIPSNEVVLFYVKFGTAYLITTSAVCFGPFRPVEQKNGSSSLLVHRVLLGTFFVILVFLSSYIGGERLAGLLTAFPLVSASLLIPALMRGYREQVAAMASGMLTAGPSLITFMLVQQVLLTSSLNIGIVFISSLLIALIVNVIMWLVVKDN